jgi:uncharacterized protein
MNITKAFYLTIGWVSVALGGLGIIMPVLPTTPFLLIAVWAFSKSSPEMAARIRNHKTFGPLIVAWQDRGAIPPMAKLLATVMMLGAGIYLVKYGPAPLWAAISACVVMLGVEIFILTRPSK